jgi:hypothetical protein
VTVCFNRWTTPEDHQRMCVQCDLHHSFTATFLGRFAALNRKFQFVSTMLAFVGLVAPIGSACTLCDLTHGATSACRTTAVSEHRHHKDEPPNLNRTQASRAVSSKKACGHQHGKPATPITKTWGGDQAFSGFQSPCCHASALFSTRIQAVVTVQNHGAPLSSVLAVKIAPAPAVQHAVNRVESVPPLSVFSDRAYLCVFLV